MINRTKRLINSPFFIGSTIMIIGSNLTNFINYIYHSLIGRLLNDPASYGVLASLISLLGILGLIPSFLGLVVVRLTAQAKSDQEIKSLIYWLNRKLFILGIIVFFLIVIISKQLSTYLNISNNLLIILVGAIFLFSLQSFFYRSVLQGLLRFKNYVISQISENIVKLILGILLVYLGFSVFGAILGILIAAIFGWYITRNYILDLFTPIKYQPPNMLKILKFSLPVFAQSIASVSMYSSDLILVKHFFSSYEAGLYASLSILGRIIFFASGPISSVMFPLVSKKSSKGEKYNKVFIYSLLVTVFFSSLILLIYGFFPDSMIIALFGSKYLAGAYLLLKFGVFMSLFTTSNLFITFYLSIGKTKYVYLQLLAAIAQIIGISLFHNTLESVIMVSILMSAILFVCLSFLYLVNFRNEK